MYNKAFKWWKKSLLSKAFRTYKYNVLTIVNDKKKLLNALAWWNKKSMFKGYQKLKLYYKWRIHRKKQYLLSRKFYYKLLQKRVIKTMVIHVESKRLQIMKAVQYFFSTKKRKSWINWKKYINHRSIKHSNILKGIDHYNDAKQWYREMKGVRRWINWLKNRKEKRLRIQTAVQLWKNKKAGAAFRSWVILVKLQKDQKLAINHYNKKYRIICVNEWHKWSVEKKIWRKKLAVLNKKAMKYWKSRKAAPPFLKWKALWSTANKIRLERERIARLLLQRVGRGLIGRNRAKTKRRINELMRPLKIQREEDITYINANELLQHRIGNQWLAIMYYSDFIVDGDSDEAKQYKLMTKAFSGAAIDMKNYWPVVRSVKVDALSSYDSQPEKNVYGLKWSRGDSLMLGPSEKLGSENLPILRLWWQGKFIFPSKNH